MIEILLCSKLGFPENTMCHMGAAVWKQSYYQKQAYG